MSWGPLEKFYPGRADPPQPPSGGIKRIASSKKPLLISMCHSTHQAIQA
jgi:hypothetical protein